MPAIVGVGGGDSLGRGASELASGFGGCIKAKQLNGHFARSRPLKNCTLQRGPLSGLRRQDMSSKKTVGTVPAKEAKRGAVHNNYSAKEKKSSRR